MRKGGGRRKGGSFYVLGLGPAVFMIIQPGPSRHAPCAVRQHAIVVSNIHGTNRAMQPEQFATSYEGFKTAYR